MASIRKRGNSYQARILRKGAPAFVRSFASEHEARRWAAQIEASITLDLPLPAESNARREPQSVPHEPFTLSSALARYAEEVTSQKRSARQEYSRIRFLQKQPIAAIDIRHLATVDFARYRDERLRTVKPTSVRLELALLSHLYETARREWGFETLRNVVKEIRKPKAARGRTRRVTDAELERLRGHCTEKLWAIIRFAVETGMRRSEIAHLTWDRVDEQRRVAMLDETKNGERRTVPLSSKALTVIRERRLVGRNETAKVFALTADAITNQFCDACQATGVVDLRFHDLRHEAVSRLFERGLSLPEVATVSGHKTWAMLRRYTHLKPEGIALKLA